MNRLRRHVLQTKLPMVAEQGPASCSHCRDIRTLAGVAEQVPSDIARAGTPAKRAAPKGAQNDAATRPGSTPKGYAVIGDPVAPHDHAVVSCIAPAFTIRSQSRIASEPSRSGTRRTHIERARYTPGSNALDQSAHLPPPARLSRVVSSSGIPLWYGGTGRGSHGRAPGGTPRVTRPNCSFSAAGPSASGALGAASALAVRSLGPPTTMSFRLAIGH